MKTVSVFIFLTLLPWYSHAEDFVLGNWGDSRDQILNLEQRTNLTPIGQFEYLVYQTDILNLMDVRVIYRFEQEQLVKGVFIFPTIAAIQAIDQFDQISNILNQKYGQAVHEGPVFSSTVTDEAEINWPELLQTDQLIFQAEWHTERTIIKHQLAHGNGQLHHQLVYQPVESPAMKPKQSPF